MKKFNSTSIVVHLENGGLGKIQIIDNGCGITKNDLGLAAQRHATSKLQSTDDFETLSSFGFRGEALASMSIVARLQIVSRTTKLPTAFMQSYQNGKPVQLKPMPQARTQGTTVTVADLFYNMPHRKKLKESEEYHKALTVVQNYAIQYPSVGFVCRKLQGSKQVIDLNTFNLSTVQNLQNSRRVGNERSKLKDIATKDVLINVVGSSIKSSLIKFTSKSNEGFTYGCEGFVTNPSYTASHPTKLILFINYRWVECNPLKKELEGLYCEFSKSKPMIYLSLQLPPNEVDVNVHPTKKQLALLHQDDIIGHICASLKEHLGSIGHVFTAAPVISNQYKRKRTDTNVSAASNLSSPSSTPLPFSQSSDKPIASRKVRVNTASPAGALEPYLVLRSNESTIVQHEPSCSMSKEFDLTQPGAFAQRCTCIVVIRKQRLVAIQPPKIMSTECSFKSIRSLRSQLVKSCCPTLKNQFRKEAIFVGMLSDQRSLVQCCLELQCWHHGKLAELLFQQLALIRFGGIQMAMLKKPVDVEFLIGFCLELEEQLSNGASDPEILEISETNQQLARQASTCLLDQREMLEEYYSIGIEKEAQKIFLIGMPILLEGYIPPLSGLPLFLLRLATEVDYEDEKASFQGICRELGLYYGKVPEKDIRHKIFPAICQLIVPYKNMAEDGTISKVTDLHRLYKMFER